MLVNLRDTYAIGYKFFDSYYIFHFHHGTLNSNFQFGGLERGLDDVIMYLRLKVAQKKNGI